jgi:hypothetical protein
VSEQTLPELKLQLEREWDERMEKWKDESSLFRELSSDRSRVKDWYWSTWRFMKGAFVDFDWYYNIKYFIQRGNRGWSDRDIWNLDTYLCTWMPDAIRKLAETKHGIPHSAIGVSGEALYVLGDNGSDKSFEDAVKIWGEVLEAMALGFEAKELLDEYGWRHDSEAEKKIERIRDDGMALFVNNFGSLWD